MSMPSSFRTFTYKRRIGSESATTRIATVRRLLAGETRPEAAAQRVHGTKLYLPRVKWE
jgi:hypothetical protein